MQETRKILIVILLAQILLFACSRKIVPGLKAGREYNMAGFDYLYVEAVRHKLTANAGNALKLFEQCIAINPESDGSYYQMAQILLSNGDIENGKKYLRKAGELQPGNLWYSMTLAGIYHQENKLDSAILWYEKAVAANEGKEELQVALARLYSKNMNYDKARSILNRFDEKYGVNEEITLPLIETLLAEKKYREAHTKMAQLLATDPDNIVFNGYLAEIYRSEGNNQKAREVYIELIGRNPDNPAIQLSLCDFLLGEKSYEELFDLLDVVIVNDRIGRDEKISLLSELIEDKDIIKGYSRQMELVLMVLESENRNDDIISLLRPGFLQNQKRYADASQRLEEILKSRPDNYFAAERLLLVLYEMKDFKTLEKRGEELASRFNRSVFAKILYSSGAMENGNYDVALEELRKADILAGSNNEIRMQVITQKADVYYRMKNFEEAFSAYDEAMKIDNSDLTVMNNYAYYLAEQNMRLKEAEKMARTVIEREKKNNTFLDTYAWVLYKRGKAREAARIMEKIITTGDSDDAEYYEHYGYILKKLGKCRDAIRNWEIAISKDESKSELKKEIGNCKR